MTSALGALASACRPLAGRLSLAIAAGAAASGASIGLMAASAWLISRAATRPPVLHLMVAIVAVRAFGVSRGFFRYCERLIGHDAALRVLGNLRVRTYAAMARLAPSDLDKRHRGDLVTRFVSDIDTLLDLLVRVILRYATALWVGVGSVALMMALCPWAGAALALGLIVVSVGVPIASSAAARVADRSLSPLRGQLAAQTIDLMHGLADLTAYGAIDDRLQDLSHIDRQLRVAAARSSGVTGIGSAITTLTSGLCVLVGLAAGTVAIRSGTMDGEILAVIVLTPLAVFETLADLPMAAQRFQAASTALGRVTAILTAPDPSPDSASAVSVPVRQTTAGHTVRFHDVHAAWDPQRPVLLGVDFTLRPGRNVALMGLSGSGKSTIAALLVRFLNPTRGSITIDNTDLRDLFADEIRRLIVLCDDEAHLFDSTIAANLLIGNPSASPEQLRQALESVRLLDWVDQLPLGLSTLVGEHGVRLSGGQRRRLALARALLSDAEVLVLDEPTEHLDEPTADAIVRDLMKATEGRTMLLITHRTRGLEAFDEVILLAEGIVHKTSTDPAKT